MDDRRRPGRPRKDEEKQTQEERRKKSGNYSGNNLKLKSPEIPGFKTRWINDEGTRIHDLTVMDDWDFVSKSEIEIRGRVDVGDPALSNTIDPGDRVSIPIKLGGGITTKAYLVKKRLEWFNEDYAERRRIGNKKLEQLYRNSGIEKERGKFDIS